MKKTALSSALAASALFLATSASATILTVFDGIPAGSASFDSTVTGAGGTVVTDVWGGISSGVTSFSRPGYTVTHNDGSPFFPTTYGSMSGQAININPDGAFGGPNGTIASGVTFLFDNPVNSVGFEVGDWATCCHNPTTDLFISFDDGAPILVASATSTADGLFPDADGANVFEIFVAAFDDSGDFTKVQFWGNGSGEFLVAGGQVKYALLQQGSLPGGVPEPASLALLGIGALGLAAARRRRQPA